MPTPTLEVPGRPPTPVPALALIIDTPTPLPTPTPEAELAPSETTTAETVSTLPEAETTTATSTPDSVNGPAATSTLELPTATSTATSTPPQQLEFTDVRVFPSFPSQVQIRFSLRDEDGRALVVSPSTLRYAITIFEASEKTSIWEEIDYDETNFFVKTAENFELELVFLLDFTNSMARATGSDGRSGIDTMLDAFEQAISSLPGTHRIGVVEFHDRNQSPGILSQLTTDRDAVLAGVNEFAESDYEPGSSRVWDGIDRAASLFTTVADNPNLVRALIFLSDGRDTSSINTRTDAGEIAKAGDVELYSLGIGEVFEEEQLTSVVESTGGVHYPTRELAALQEQLCRVVTDLVGQYRVNYVTLRRQGLYRTRVDVELRDAVGSFELASLDVSDFYAPDDRGRIAVDTPSLDKETGVAQIFIRALHVPRNVSAFRFSIDTVKTVTTTLVESSDGGILGDWYLSGPDRQGFYNVTSSSPLEFGNLGVLFHITMAGVTEKSIQVPLKFDNRIYSAGKRFDHPPSFYIGERIPPSGRIAFRTNRDGNDEVYVMEYNGSAQTNLTAKIEGDFQASWSPEGDMIAFDTSRNFYRNIYLMDDDGGNQVRLTGGVYNDSLPEWSPDGSRIAFDSRRDGNREIYLIDPSGVAATRMTNEPANDWWASWSPDSTMIAFTSYRDGNAEIYVMDIAGTFATNLTNHPAGDFRPVWSPDGDKIAFYSYRDGNREIYVMNANGGGQTNVTIHPSHDWYPTWAPDGVRLAFATTRDGNREVYIMNSDGSGLVNISTTPPTTGRLFGGRPSRMSRVK